jgi:dTDP-4-amino-4,6-dideoxygalactose transaminase
MIYYPVPLYAQDAFKPFTELTHLPISELLCQEVISLPMHTELDQEQLNYIAEAVKSF